MITLGTVNISEKTKSLMQDALNSGIISQGEYVKEFEDRLANFLGVKHVIAMANGTLADACAVAALKVGDKKGRNEVIVPALTFIAQINSLYYNHLKPVFVDIGYDFQIDVKKIEEKINEKTLAIMPVHLLGRPAEMEKILLLAKKHNLFVVEDACEALGSKYKNQSCGTIGDIGTFSFYISHSVTTGEGGAAVTNNDELADNLRSLRNHGRKSDKFEEKFIFPHIGFSAKMNALEAAVGLGAIDELPRYVKARHDNMVKLNETLGHNYFFDGDNDYIVPHAYPVLIKSKEQRNKLLIDFPSKFGVECRQIFSCIPTQSGAYSFFGEKSSYPIAEDVGDRGMYVPCHQNLKEEDIAKIVDALKYIKNEGFLAE